MSRRSCGAGSFFLWWSEARLGALPLSHQHLPVQRAEFCFAWRHPQVPERLGSFVSRKTLELICDPSHGLLRVGLKIRHNANTEVLKPALYSSVDLVVDARVFFTQRLQY